MLPTWVEILLAFVASSGFWTLLQHLIDKKSCTNEMLVGLGHDRILFLGKSYIERGYITTEEYENLHDYLYLPYKKLGGNGTAEKIMNEVEKLPTQLYSGDDLNE